MKSLLVFLLFGVTVGLLAVGPRSVFRSRWPYLAGLVAIALWLPNLIWQSQHDWPQLELSQAIADGSSGTSDSPVEFVLLQLGLVSPFLVPVWAVGCGGCGATPTWRPGVASAWPTRCCWSCSCSAAARRTTWPASTRSCSRRALRSCSSGSLGTVDGRCCAGPCWSAGSPRSTSSCRSRLRRSSTG